MGLHKKYFFSGERYYEPNTFIGGIGGVVSNKSLLSARLIGLDEADIKNFQIDENNNVSCFIEKDYFPNFRGADIGNILRYFEDRNGNIKALGLAVFQQQGSIAYNFPEVAIINGYSLQQNAFKCLALPKLTTIQGQSSVYRNTVSHYFYAKNLTTILNGYHFRNTTTSNNWRRIYMPKCTQIGSVDVGDDNFALLRTGCKIYIEPSMLTINSGEPQADLAYAQNSRGATLVPVTSFAVPEEITDLSASNITVNTVDLNFTPPASTNALDFYEVWIERQDLGEFHQDRVKERLNIHSEITNSGQTIIGLLSSTTYKIKIAACDEFWNGSGMSDTPSFSNEISFTTL